MIRRLDFYSALFVIHQPDSFFFGKTANDSSDFESYVAGEFLVFNILCDIFPSVHIGLGLAVAFHLVDEL